MIRKANNYDISIAGVTILQYDTTIAALFQAGFNGTTHFVIPVSHLAIGIA